MTDARASRRAKLHGIYAIVEPERRELESFVDDLLAGGIRLFQIRAKGGIAPGRLRAIVARVHAHDGIVIVNDDVALAQDADGVHLGQEDLAQVDLTDVRSRLGDRLIGVSCGVPAEARAVDPELVDYIGVGPMIATRSKRDAGLPIGASGVRAVVAAAPVPAAAIGGLDLASLPRVRESGAAMAAIISALAEPSDALATARSFVRAWES